MSVGDVLVSLLIAGLLLLASKFIRMRIEILRRVFIPGSIIAGFLALLLGPQVLGWIFTRAVGPDSALADGMFPQAVLDSWQSLPGILINVVFAALFLGKALPGPREIWHRAGPQVVFGQIVAWGQYVVGIGLALLVLAPLFGTNPIAGALIEIGFEGGHGTAAGMAPAFEAAGFEEGTDLALALATIGLVMGVLIGTVLVNWAIRTGQVSITEKGEVHPSSLSPDELDVSITEKDKKELKKQKRLQISPTDPLSLHLGIVGLAIALGWLMLQGLRWVESVTWGRPPTQEEIDAALAAGQEAPEALVLMAYLPLFPLAMIGGVIIQIIITRMGWSRFVSRPLMSRICGTALDFTIVSALATLSLAAIGEHLIPVLSLAGIGIAWCVFALVYIAPRIIPLNWFERGIGDFGQSMGVTVTGLLLMRMADPENRSQCLESFGYKQLLFEPIVGGGLFTGMSVGLIAAYGPVSILTFCAILTVAWLLFGLLYFGPMVREQRAKG
ncbi:MAG: sodium:glutamate symporter, partial [Phycisphaerales bacterium]